MIYLYHTRRTGGRSVIFSVLGSLGDPQNLYNECCKGEMSIGDKRICGWQPQPEPNTFFAWSHEPAWRVILPQGSFTITLIRDPLERLLSHYGMLLLEDANGRRWGSPKIEFKWLGNGPEDFIKNIPREHKLRQLFMFSQRFDPSEAEDRIHEVSLWFWVEEMNKGIAELAEIIQTPLTVHHVRETDWRPKVRVNIKLKPRVVNLWREELALEYEFVEAL